MDVRCPKCGEPWDLDTIHDRAAELNADAYDSDSLITYEDVAADFRRRGCAALGEACPPPELRVEGAPDPATGLSASETAATLYELLGDDMDGAAAMLEDLGF